MVITRTFRTSLLALPLLLASIAPPAIYAITPQESAISSRAEMQPEEFATAVFSTGFELFYAGPQWFLNALSNPRSRNPFVRSFMYDSAGDRVGAENGYVGTLRDVFDVGLFSNVSGFATASGSSKTSTPRILDVNSTVNWNITTGSTASPAAWLLNTNWSTTSVPDGTDTANFATATTGVGIDMGGSTNNGATNQAVGAITISNGSGNLTIGNSSTATNGTLTLNGATVNAVPNTILSLGVTTADRTLTLQNTIGSGNKTMTIALGNTSNVISTVQPSSGTNSIVILSNISQVNSGSSITYNGSSGSNLTLSGANTYSGGTTVNTGTLAVGSSSTVGGGVVTSGPVGTGLLTLATGTFLRADGTTTRTLENDVSVSGTINLGSTGGSTNGTLVFNSSGLTTAATWTLAANTSMTINSAVNIDNVVSGGFTLSKGGTSTLTLSGANTYSGVTSINNGTLSVSNIGNTGSNSNLGTNGSINIGSTSNTGVLLYTGSGETSNKVINLAGTTGGATIDQSGTGLLKFTTNLTATGAGSKTLTLTGSTAGTGEISGAIVDNSGTNKTSIVKSGTGTWTLSGTNTYTGLTTVTDGKLFINGNSSAATGLVNVNSGGTTLGGNGTTGGAVTVASGSNLSPGPTGVGSVAALGTGSLTLNSGSFFNVDLNSTTPATGYDQVLVTGTVSVSGSNLVVSSTFTPALSDIFFIVVNDGPATDVVTGVFGTVSSGWVVSYTADFDSGLLVGGNDIALTPIPEPSTWIGGALALAAIGFTQRRRIRGLIARRA